MEDVIEEILLLLPAKALTRCKCLSKKWNHFISYDTTFHRSYLSRMNGSSLLLGFFNKIQKWKTNLDGIDNIRFLPCCTEGYKLKVGDKTMGTHQPLPHRFDESLGFLGHETICVVASSNGFLLCCVEKYDPMSYYVCNPITKEWVALPKPNLTSKLSPTDFFCKGDYPCLDMVHYKVVRGIRPYPRTLSNELTIEVFSSESLDWKVYNKSCASPFKLHVYSAYLLLNESGIVHWMGITETCSCCVIVFDPSKKWLERIVLPGGKKLKTIHYPPCEVDGEIVIVRREVDNYLEIWSLSLHDRELSLKHRVSLETTMKNHPRLFTGLYRSFKVLRFHPSNPRVIFIWVNNKIACYNFEKSTVKVVCDFPGHELGHSNFVAYVWPIWPPFFPQSVSCDA